MNTKEYKKGLTNTVSIINMKKINNGSLVAIIWLRGNFNCSNWNKWR